MTPSPLTRDQWIRFQKLMDENRNTALVFLSAQLNELFGSTDEALLDFAEQAENNALQGRFYEAIGLVRTYRSQLELRYREEIHAGFEHFGEEGQAEQDSALDPDSELSLIGRDEMEESVAAENLANNARSSYYVELYALSQRLAVVNGGRKIAEADIPTGPQHLVQAFKQSVSDLNIDIKAKFVLYALYEKFVLKQLKSLYDEQNDNLKQAGILPNLRPGVSMNDVRRSPDASQAKGQQPETTPETLAHDSEPVMNTRAGGAGTTQPHANASAPGMGSKGALGMELFSSILDLLAVRRGGVPMHARAYAASVGPGAAMSGTAGTNTGMAHNMAGAAAPPAGGATGGLAQSVSPNLISAIDDVRPSSLGHGTGVLADLNALPQIAVDPQFLDKLKGVLHQEREEILSRVEEDDIQEVDSDTIDLVGMLFEYMLNDPLLPNLAKALLSHLHTPYLKLALTDRQLLVDSEHPARLMLDMLVEAGGQWVYENDVKRGIYPQMQRVVDRVLQEFSDNEGLFPELISEFRASMNEHRRKSEAIESRAQDSMKGREKLQVAKMRATREMQAREQMTPMPKSARRFLTQAWSDRLVFILLRHEEAELGDEWTQALQVADDLVWLFDPSSADAGDAEIRNTGKRVHEAVESALDTLGGYHQHYLHELFGFLDDPDTIAAWRSDRELSDMVDSALADSDYAAEQAFPSQEAPEPVDALAHTAGAAHENLEPRADPGPEQQEMLNKLHTLKFDTWFEFNQAGLGSRRLKLSWLSPLTSTCMFVDKSGVQAEVKSLEDVASMLVAGQCKIIPKPRHRFVERALLAIKNTLQRSMEATD